MLPKTAGSAQTHKSISSIELFGICISLSRVRSCDSSTFRTCTSILNWNESSTERKGQWEIVVYASEVKKLEFLDAMVFGSFTPFFKIFEIFEKF